jgi:flavin reductase (DIM6/NTAB) family NADH-FMN oxidoreductase RutF
MSKLVWKGSTQLSPLPAVLVTCGSAEKPNILTIAWTGIVCSQPPRTYISVRPERYSHALLCETGEFVINLTTQALCRATDYCGVRSGRDEDKLAAMHLETEPGETVNVPVLAASPLALECKVFERVPLGSHDMFLADITAIRVDEKYIDAAGKLSLDDAGLLAYTHGEYRTLGRVLGTFGYSVRKKPLRR